MTMARPAPAFKMSHNVPRFATRRQARESLRHAPLNSINAVTLLHALGAVYPEAREARVGANRTVIRRPSLRQPTTATRLQTAKGRRHRIATRLS